MCALKHESLMPKYSFYDKHEICTNTSFVRHFYAPQSRVAFPMDPASYEAVAVT